MKKNWKPVVLLLLVVLAVSLSGCGEKAQSIVGKWTSKEFADSMGGAGMSTVFGDNAKMTFEFTKEGKMLFLVNDKPVEEAMKEAVGSMGLPAEAAADMPAAVFPEISYKLDGNKITMDMKMGGESQSATGEFKLEGDKLTITVDGQSLTFDKAK